MAKAEKGDLIRITDSEDAEPGKIYEVINVDESGDVYVDGTFKNGESLWFYDDEYEIFRRAGEEDDGVEITAEHFDGTADVSDAQITQANRIRSACSELADLLVRKNHDYGDSFSQQYSKYGLMSALIRMDDKMRRLETLQQAESKAQVDESISDTLLDLAGYALLSYVEQSKTK